MDVATPDETSVSGWSVLTAVLAGCLSAAIVVPGVFRPEYARAGAWMLLAVGVALSTRAVVAALVAFVPPSPPEPLPESSLPSVSVVVTAYNEADVLPATLGACLAMDYPAEKLEVVVGYEVASTDGTAAVARAASAAPRVRVVGRDPPPGGKAAATNHALEAATGDVIALLDADQRPEPGALRRAVRWFRIDDVRCVKGRCFGTNPEASPLALLSTVERGLVERTEFYARDRLGGFALFTGGQAFFQAAALEEVGAFDESILLADLDMAYRIQRAGGDVRIDPGVVTRERNPATLSAWWNQRKRWARGGMQIARRYLGPGLLSGPPSAGARVDFAATFGTLLASPILIAATPLVPLAWQWADASVAATSCPFPDGPAVALWTWVLAGPVAAATLWLVLDVHDGRRHAPSEYAGPLLLWPYLALQALVVLVAFVEASLLRRPAVYVTSTRSDDSD